MPSHTKIGLNDLGRLEALELQSLLGQQAELKESHPLQTSQQGDAATFSLIMNATPWVAGIIGMWLLKPRKGKTVKQKFTRTDAAGREHQVEVYIHEYSSESPSNTVVNALAKLFGFGNNVIQDAIDQATAEKK